MIIAILGSQGMIGNGLVRYLREMGYKVNEIQRLNLI